MLRFSEFAVFACERVVGKRLRVHCAGQHVRPRLVVVYLVPISLSCLISTFSHRLVLSNYDSEG